MARLLPAAALFAIFGLLSSTPDAHSAEDCTQKGLDQITALRSAVSIRNLSSPRFDAEKIKSLNAQVQKTVASKCFDRERAKGISYAWDYGIDLQNRRLDLKELVLRDQKSFRLYASHGEGARAQTVRKNELDIYRVLDLPPPADLAAPLSTRTGNVCTPVNIAKELPPVRNQAQTNWCNFFAYADLFSFETHANISPAYLGMLLGPDGLSGSGTPEMVTVVSHYGLCRESTLPFELDTDKSRTALRNLSENASGCHREQDIREVFPTTAVDRVSALFASKVFQRILTLDPAIAGFGAKVFTDNPISNAALKVCLADRAKYGIKNLEKRLVGAESSSQPDFALKSIETIDQGLSAGKPVELEYLYDVATHQGAGGGHVSVVVGRRFINGKCQYLVRNSWGRSSCTKIVAEKDACDPPGHFWIDFETLERSATHAHYIK